MKKFIVFVFISLFAFSLYATETKIFNLELIKHGKSEINVTKDGSELKSIVFDFADTMQRPAVSNASFDISWTLYSEYNDNGDTSSNYSMNLYFVSSAENYDNGYMLMPTEEASGDDIGLNYSVSLSGLYTDSNGNANLLSENNGIKAPEGETLDHSMPLKYRKLKILENVSLDILYPVTGNATIKLTLLAPWGKVGGTEEYYDYRFMPGQYTGWVFLEMIVY